MTLNHFKSAWRSLLHNRRYTIINISGLAIAITACVLIGLFAGNELSFDKQIPAKEHVYRMNEYIHYPGTTPQLGAASGLPLAPLLASDYSQIQDYVRVYPATPYIYPSTTLEYQGKKVPGANLLCTDTGFARMFGIRTLEGSQEPFMQDRNSIVLTQSLAQKLFGKEPALNKMVELRVDDTTAYKMAVTQVIPDFSPTFHLQADGLLPIPDFYIKGWAGNNYGILLGPSYLRLRPNIGPAGIAALDTQFTRTIHTKNTGIDIRLQPVTDVHSGSMEMNYDELNAKKIDGKYLRIFIIIALAIFVIACSNFVNLTIAIAAYRGKEIAVKKIMGAGRGRIIVQVLTEAFLSVMIAVLLSLALAFVCLPFLNGLVGRHLPAGSLFQWPVIGMYLTILVVTTLLAGAYPAVLISAAKIDQALRTKLLFGRSRTSLRNVLVTGQFAIAVVFIIGLTVFLRQLNYMENKDLGYSYQQVVKVPLDMLSANKIETLRSELLKIKGVKDLTYGYLMLGDKGGTFGVDYIAPDGATKHISAIMENGAPNYLRFFNMKIVAGRDFTPVNPQNEYIINESMAKLLGHADPIGKEINLAGGLPKGVIVGVVKDFNFSSLHDKVKPLLIASIGYIAVWKQQLYIKVDADGVAETLTGIGAALKPFFRDREPELRFLDEHFRQVYNAERQASSMIAIIGGLAIGIACLGLLSLAAFVILRRTKEIGIRKVLGASITGIVTTLSKEFIGLVVIAFLIAAPIAWWLMSGWLQGFPYRVAMSWWIFAAAAVAAVGVAFLTISFLTVRAAKANPVNALRTE
jgi:putative ABC transport system permease protein